MPMLFVYLFGAIYYTYSEDGNTCLDDLAMSTRTKHSDSDQLARLRLHRKVECRGCCIKLPRAFMDLKTDWKRPVA